MKKQFLRLIAILFLLFGCDEQKNESETVKKETEPVENTNEKIDSLTISIKDKYVNDNSVIEKYYPDEKKTVEFDTIISARNLRISIQSRFLDSYVTNEFESEGKKHIDKYRNSEKHLIIKRSNEILIDTVFKKNDFVNLAGQDFLNIADFHGYWFNEIDNDTVELFGVISRPETDWSIAFYHYFDLKTRTFKIEEQINDEI